VGGAWEESPPRPFEINRFWCNLGVKLQKLDDLLVKLVVVLEAPRIKGVNLLRAAKAAK